MGNCLGAIAVLGVAGLCAESHGQLAYVAQQRTISATTSGNGQTASASAPDFGPFTETVGTTTTLDTGGGTVVNGSVSRIDCQLNPNRLQAGGALGGSGGEIEPGHSAIGDSRVSVDVTFDVADTTPFVLAAAPRPALHATDEFLLELRDITRNDRIVSLDALDAPQRVAMSGTLQPGTYRFRYKLECTFDGPEDSREYAASLSVNCAADFNRANGVDVQDIFDYLAAWFAGDASADVDGVAGLAVEDVFAFLNTWMAGC